MQMKESAIIELFENFDYENQSIPQIALGL